MYLGQEEQDNQGQVDDMQLTTLVGALGQYIIPLVTGYEWLYQNRCS